MARTDRRTSRSRRPARDESGVAFPSPLIILSIIAVAMAGIAFVTTMNNGDDGDKMTTVSDSGPDAAEQESTPGGASEPPTPKATKKPTKPKAPKVNPAKTYVEVYNNSGIAGLAGSTASKASGAGWNVVAADNWYGMVPATTVYYPERLKAAADMLAKDLGIGRVIPAVDPMRFDRLTVILTSDYTG
ncbi:MAG: LytR C-terminal domain-containing protein [Nocardioides sp.]|nr:LytR C-terminal domain-containing protein [Nocardioides sp.]